LDENVGAAQPGQAGTDDADVKWASAHDVGAMADDSGCFLNYIQKKMRR
jgi:hypothetical protein